MEIDIAAGEVGGATVADSAEIAEYLRTLHRLYDLYPLHLALQSLDEAAPPH